MALFDRLRRWIGDVLGIAGASEEDGPGTDPSRLDPDNVTEVRTEADDDPVGKLRDVEQQRSANEREDGQPKG